VFDDFAAQLGNVVCSQYKVIVPGIVIGQRVPITTPKYALKLAQPNPRDQVTSSRFTLPPSMPSIPDGNLMMSASGIFRIRCRSDSAN
jgi:hypothetical protein